ncbi:MAG: TMEM143 family protein [Thiohalomonadales bacterium]
MKALRFIPFRKIDVLDMCISRGDLQPSERQEFEQLYQLIQSILHFEFHSYLDILKNSYAPFDPDSDTREIYNLSTEDDQFVEFLEDILNKANYEKIPQIELEKALKVASLFKIKLKVDFTEYSEVLLYYRGANIKTERVRYWFSLFSKKITFTNYDRVVIYLKQKASNQIKTSDKKSKTGAIFLKLFRNVPKSDLEMLFPNTQIKMRTIDKLMIGIPAALSGGLIVFTKLSATIILLASLIGYWFELSTTEIEIDKTKLLILLAGVGTLAAYLWKQLNNFKNKKLQFMKTLTDNLYLKNLDNNAGVFHRLLDDAEE